ncbi:MAG: Ig domain-containing protein [Clostridiales bacterium]|nr:Ig domain-containing protein [Clostridiales bacterium]
MKTTIRKLLSVLLALLMMIGVIAVAPVTAGAAGPVCSIGATLYYDLDDVWYDLESGDTITLLDDITYPYGFTINAFTYIFDLNGYTLNFGNDITANNGSQFLLADPGNGELNVNGQVYASASKVEVSNVNCANNGSSAVVANANAEVIVYGNVSHTGTSGFGANAHGGGEITIDGTLTVSPGVAYINCGNTDLLPGDYDASTNKTGYLQYRGFGTGTVWVKDPAVCSIGTTRYNNLADALAAVTSGQTIKLLDDITYNSGIIINSKSITFDLNGKKLDVVNTSGRGLDVSNSGEVKLLNPANGEFNVTGTTDGVYASNSKVEVTNIKATRTSGFAYGVFAANSGTEVTIYGDVTVVGNSSTTYGVYATNNANVTVNGSIIAPAGATYIQVGGVAKTQAQFTTPTTKNGYLTYTGGTSTVWVKDTRPAVCEIGTQGYADLADALAAVTDGQTIKLLDDITYDSEIDITTSKTVTFDLNGYTLNATRGVRARTGGQVLLADPGNGEFNVSGILGGTTITVYAQDSGSKIEVTNVNAAFPVRAVYAYNNGTVIVYGNVTHTGTSGKGANALEGGKITVEGIITVPLGVNYVCVGAVDKTQAEYEANTTKPGYYEYKGTYDSYDTDYIWVKGNAPAITTASLPGGTVGAAYGQTLAATGDTPIAWSVVGSLPGGLALNAATGVISGTPTAAGTANFTVKAQNGCGEDTKALTIVIAAAKPDKGIFGTNAKWYGAWWHYLLFFFCFGFIWMWF